MCGVHASRGPLAPASPQLRSEVSIVTSIAEATLGDRSRHRLGGHAATTTRASGATSPASCPDARTTRPGVAKPGGFVMPHPPRDSPRVRHPLGPGGVRRVARSRCCRCRPVTWCCRRCAATTSSTPPSTASATVTAASRAGGRWSWSTARDIERRLRGRRPGRPRHPLAGRRHRPPGRVVPHRRVRQTPAARPRPTTPRPTRWCRSDSAARGQQHAHLEVSDGPAGGQRLKDCRIGGARGSTRQPPSWR